MSEEEETTRALLRGRDLDSYKSLKNCLDGRVGSKMYFSPRATEKLITGLGDTLGAYKRGTAQRGFSSPRARFDGHGLEEYLEDGIGFGSQKMYFRS